MKNPKKMLFDNVKNIIPDIKNSISKNLLAEKLYETLQGNILFILIYVAWMMLFEN